MPNGMCYGRGNITVSHPLRKKYIAITGMSVKVKGVVSFLIAEYPSIQGALNAINADTVTWNSAIQQVNT